MKLKRILSVLLLLSVLLSVAACSFLSVSSSDKVETTVYDYLKNKYPDLAFEIKSYTKDTYTSGRYVFSVFCTTTAVDFTVYHSSFLTTDSYSVVHVNADMEKSLRDILGEELDSRYAETVQWKNLYADGSDGYRFRNMDITKMPYAPTEVSEIYRFALKNNSYETETEAVQAMKNVIAKFADAGIVLNKIVFQFSLGKDTVLLTTDTYTVQTAAEETLENLLVHIKTAQETDTLVEVVYGSDLKKAEYFLENQTEDSDGGDSSETSGTEQQTENTTK
ncbi:MAG: hypothetical protein E7603_00975 [Ruminococcaceae bacterium]|nr:hypothetical protein [Oscillospiraceae bacterium]